MFPAEKERLLQPYYFIGKEKVHCNFEITVDLWWRRGESNPCPKVLPQGLLRAQSFDWNSRCCTPNDRLTGLVASSCMGGAKLTRRTFTAK